MRSSFDFTDLFVFEMANNHQGSVAHGKRIIEEMSRVAKVNGVRAAIKFQFRDLSTFVHQSHRVGSTNKHVPRFLSTALSKANFEELVGFARQEHLLTMATPFDEVSVGTALDLGVDILKVASCSGKDYPLLQALVFAGKPVLASNGGLTAIETGLLVQIFTEAQLPFALQHCVAKYPTQIHELQLSEITRLKRWFPGLIIGFSTHEAPERTDVIKMAYAKGARTFEKHVGVPTEDITLNAYSANPMQVDAWVKAWKEAVSAEGGEVRVVDDTEHRSLIELQRGVFAKKRLAKGQVVTCDDVYFAFPMQDGQCASGDFSPGCVADKEYEKHAPLDSLGVRPSRESLIREAMVQARMLINQAGAVLPTEFEWEFSHHYGMEQYGKTGLTMVEIINREYCHKLLVVFPGQGNPYHHHKKKEETFRIIWGDLHADCGGVMRVLSPGDLFTVERGAVHQFRSVDGCVFEEISTTQLADDSFYEDSSISQRPREERKTRVRAKR